MKQRFLRAINVWPLKRWTVTARCNSSSTTSPAPHDDDWPRWSSGRVIGFRWLERSEVVAPDSRIIAEAGKERDATLVISDNEVVPIF